MSDTTMDPGRSQSKTVSGLVWTTVGLALAIYGLVAFNAGSKLTPTLNQDNQQHAQTVAHIQEQSSQGVSMAGQPETEVLPFWVNLMARIGPENYAYGPDGIMETEQRYHQMESSRRHVLSTHMMLGLIIMIAGFFQFWPSFRHKHRVAHRLLGRLYILAAMASMSMSAYFLIKTGVDETFNGFVFFSGLWALLILSLSSIGMAMWAIYKRQAGIHLGWQALAFGCFLSAPIQRAIWVGMAPAAGEASFNEMNIAVNVSLFAFCFLASYGLFYANRHGARVRAQASDELRGLGTKARWVLGLLLVTGVLQSFAFYGYSGGLSDSAFVQGLVPAAAISLHDAALGSAMPWLLLLAVTGFVAVAARLLLTKAAPSQLASSQIACLTVSGVLIGGIYLNWGLSLGMPDHDRSVAGVFYAVTGSILLFFVVLFSLGAARGELAKAREWLWFGALLAIAPGIMYGQLFSLHLIDIVPENWRHHGYQLAAAIAMSMPILWAHLIAVYSKLTTTRAIS